MSARILLNSDADVMWYDITWVFSFMLTCALQHSIPGENKDCTQSTAKEINCKLLKECKISVSLLNCEGSVGTVKWNAYSARIESAERCHAWVAALHAWNQVVWWANTGEWKHCGSSWLTNTLSQWVQVERWIKLSYCTQRYCSGCLEGRWRLWKAWSKDLWLLHCNWGNTYSTFSHDTSTFSASS